MAALEGDIEGARALVNEGANVNAATDLVGLFITCNLLVHDTIIES